jgi:hypothetical protein
MAVKDVELTWRDRTKKLIALLTRGVIKVRRRETLPSEDFDFDGFVPIKGVIHLITSLGVFLDVEDRRVFVGIHCMQPIDERLEPGATVTLQVVRSFAEQERLVA